MRKSYGNNILAFWGLLVKEKNIENIGNKGLRLFLKKGIISMNDCVSFELFFLEKQIKFKMDFQYEKMKFKRFLKSRKMAVFVVLALLIVSVFLYWRMKKNEVVSLKDIPSEKSIENEEVSSNETQTEKENLQENKEENVSVLLEKPDDIGTLSSENYKISQIYFGGSVALLESDFDNDPIEISFNRAETFIAGDEDESKLAITWKTSKPAVSEIEYSKSGGQNPVVIREKEYGINHSVTIGNLDPGTAYLYRIKVKDRWNNEAKTNYIGIYTDKKKESVFDLIAGAIEDVFGWALKR